MAKSSKENETLIFPPRGRIEIILEQNLVKGDGDTT